MLQFKELPKGEDSIDRPGSYAIMPRGQEIVLVRIISWGKYFLPGGGIEAGEYPEEALLREIQEETGFLVSALEKICEAAEYVYSPVVGTYLNKQGLYYTAKIIGQDTSLIIEDDLEMEYLPVDKAIEVLYLESQKWAVQQWMDKKNGKTTA
jgi:8-oxo-dGTP diphosphatase